MTLTTSITSLSGIGPIMAKKLAKLNIYTIFDLLYHLPFRYEDRSKVSLIDHIKIGDSTTIIGTIDSIKNDFTRKGRVIQSGQISDSSGTIKVLWFNQPFLPRTLKAGMKVAFFGKVDFYGREKALISPDYEIDNGEHIHMARIISIYPETAGITSKYLRTKIFNLLKTMNLTDFLPAHTHDIDWANAIREIHTPSVSYDLGPNIYRQRLAFDELLLAHLTSLVRKDTWHQTKLTHSFAIDSTKVDEFINKLPFTLTDSQRQATTEILTDLSKTEPMNRLLEGDVGSGKTVVAAIAAYVARLNNFQTLILAPTQILANQHFKTLDGLFKPLGIKVGLITGTSKAKAKNSASQIVVGTHALLSQKLDFAQVGLVVIDEQHRFGVNQRALATQTGQSPHILTMTATPIPRTIALTLYGDLDLSVLTATPSGRLKVKTWVVPETKREPSYGWISSQLKDNNSQAFWVCPFIEDSESLNTVKSATTEFDRLTTIFPQLRLGLLHGKLKSAEKDNVMAKFKNHELDILVCTPVVEVGIDIPNATIMVIEAAERFGLAQLHQLRGRVGRGDQQSYCLLFSNKPTQRLRAMETHHSGLELAEIDLQLRGPGEIYGTSQHGLAQFRVANYSDIDIIHQAQKSAVSILPQLNSLPVLRSLLDQGKIDAVQPN